MTRFLSTVAAAVLLLAPLAATAQIPGGATQAPNPTPGAPGISRPGTAIAPAPAPAPAPMTPAAAPMAAPMKPMRHRMMRHRPAHAAHAMHARPAHAMKPMRGGNTRSRDTASGDAAVERLNEQSLANARGGK